MISPPNWQPLWTGRASFVLFDADFADGSTFAAVLQAWRSDPRRCRRLHYIALAPHAELPGFRRLPSYGDNVTVDLLGPARGTAPAAQLDAALAQLRARIDGAWLHDMQAQGSGFARALGALAAPGLRVFGSGLSAAQLRALEAASFTCTTLAQEGDVDAHYTSRRPFRALPAAPRPRAIVIGAGLAGSAACERLCARGWHVTLIERHAHPASEASGNLAGISMPLLSRDDNHMTRLMRAAFLFAHDYWDKLGGVGPDQAIDGACCGVLQLARDPAHGEVQRAIAEEAAYPPQFARWLDAAEALDMLGSPAPDGAWLFPGGGWLRPASACGVMLTACGDALVRHFGVGSVTLEQQADGWTVRNADGAAIASAPVVILAGGAATVQLAQAAQLPLAAVRGQVTHLAAGSVRNLPFVLCREAYLTPATHGWHSAGATYDEDADPALRLTSQETNLARLRALLRDPDAAFDAPLAGRVGFRSVAPDRLPLVGALPDPSAAAGQERLRDMPRYPGLYALLGYASRGLAWAPLAAELLAAQLDGAPLPLEAELVDALDPARFALKARRRTSA